MGFLAKPLYRTAYITLVKVTKMVTISEAHAQHIVKDKSGKVRKKELSKSLNKIQNVCTEFVNGKPCKEKVRP